METAKKEAEKEDGVGGRRVKPAGSEPATLPRSAWTFPLTARSPPPSPLCPAAEGPQNQAPPPKLSPPPHIKASAKLSDYKLSLIQPGR
jgi:hypothetical protein